MMRKLRLKLLKRVIQYCLCTYYTYAQRANSYHCAQRENIRVIVRTEECQRQQFRLQLQAFRSKANKQIQ